MVKEIHIVPAMVRSNESIILIEIMADDAVYSFSMSSLPFFWVLPKQICLSSRDHNHKGHGSLVFYGSNSVRLCAKNSGGINDNLRLFCYLLCLALCFDTTILGTSCVLLGAQDNGILVFVE